VILCDARVERVAGDAVWVRCETSPSCEQCASGRGCAAYLFARDNKSGHNVVRADADGGIHLEPGDAVTVGVPAAELQRAALLLYSVPLGGLLAGAVIGTLAGSDLTTLIGAAIGLALGFLPARRMDRRIRQSGAWRPRVIRRNDKTGSP
jgi:sigma-E factor negative regulatory protein RseC